MKKILWILVLAVLAFSATDTWEGDDSNDMNVGSNWDNGTVPGTDDDVVFDGTASGPAQMTAAMDVLSFTQTSAWSEDFDQNSQSLTVSGNCTFDGDDDANTLTLDAAITLDADGNFGIDGYNTATMAGDIDLQGDGNLAMGQSIVSGGKFTLAAAGKTTIVTGSIPVSKELDIGAGTLTLSQSIDLRAETNDALTVHADATINGTANKIFQIKVYIDGTNLLVPALTVDNDVAVTLEGRQNGAGDACILTLAGNITAGEIRFAKRGTAAFTANLGSYNLTTTGGATLDFEAGNTNATNIFTLNAGTGTHTIIGRANFDYNTTGASVFNLQSSTWLIGANLEVSATNTTLDAGTSDMTMDGTLASTLTSGGHAFYDMTINKTGNGVTQDDAAIANDIVLTDGTYDMGGNTLSCADLTINSADALTFDAAVTTSGDVTTGVAVTINRLIMTSGKTLTQKESANFTLSNYTATDLDGVVFVSAAPGTASDFVNPASMTVLNANVTDNNATNVIDATTGGTDGGGNTNWNFGGEVIVIARAGAYRKGAFRFKPYRLGAYK